MGNELGNDWVTTINGQRRNRPYIKVNKVSCTSTPRSLRVTMPHIILAQATDADPGTWWWIVGSLVLVLIAAFYFFYYFLLVRLPLWVLRHTLYRVHIHG